MRILPLSVSFILALSLSLVACTPDAPPASPSRTTPASPRAASPGPSPAPCPVPRTFGRLLPTLPAARPVSLKATAALARAIVADEEPEFTPEGEVDNEENLPLPAGYTYVGQFLDHDITLNPEQGNLATKTLDPSRLRNLRTPLLDLDSLYGNHQRDSNLYDKTNPALLLLGPRLQGASSDPNARDNLRSPTTGRALIPDPRNDENRIVASLHTILARYHNLQVRRIDTQHPDLTPDQTFTRARRLTTLNYQAAILRDFLPRIAGHDAVQHALNNSSPLYDPCTQGMPVEFAVAAYRFGHSMVRPVYRINHTVTERLPVFSNSLDPHTNLAGFSHSPLDFAIDWSLLLPIDPDVDPQESYKMDASLVSPLGLLPLPETGDGVNNLASRNLLRAQQLSLPSGQAVARALGVTPLDDSRILIGKATGIPADQTPLSSISKEFEDNAPLWVYVLAETGASPHLGPVGARIVAETIIGLLRADPNSILNTPPEDFSTPDPSFPQIVRRVIQDTTDTAPSPPLP